MITREAVYDDAPTSAAAGGWRAVVLALGDIGRAGSMAFQALVMMPLTCIIWFTSSCRSFPMFLHLS